MPTQKPLILFDIDQTLFNTPQYIENHLNDFAKFLGTTSKQMLETLSNYRDTLTGGQIDFSPHEYLDYVAKTFKTSANELAEILYSKSNFHSALYPEVKEVLTTLKNSGYPLGIYSEGVLDWQMNKLKANGIWEFFKPEHRHILRRKMDKKILASLPEGTIIIDDKPAIIEFLTGFPQIIPLHIVRNSKEHAGEYTLSSLNDLFVILASLRHTGGGIK